jgi:N-acetylmuramoyl-L-alanine amidase
MSGRMRIPAVSSLLALVAMAAACATGRGARGPAAPGGESALPPIPHVSGPLSLRVTYPDSLARIAVRDSNFLFGSTGTGDAGLTIDGTPVSVEPNGAFLAWLPVPPPTAGDTAHYLLVARNGERADTLRWPVLLPSDPGRGMGPAWIDTAALSHSAERWARPDEEIRLGLRGAPGSRVWIESGERQYALREVAPGRYQLRLPARELYDVGRGADSLPGESPAADSTGEPAAGAAETGSPAPTDTAEHHLAGRRGAAPPMRVARRPSSAPLDSIAFRVILVAGGDTARATGCYPLRIIDPRSPVVAELVEAPDSVNGPATVVVGRPLPSGPYLWRFPDRTVAAIDGRVGDRLRVRLGPGLEAWTDTSDARIYPKGTPPPQVRVGDVRIDHAPEGLRVELRLASRVPVRVRERGARISLTLYDSRGGTNRLMYGRRDPLLRNAEWDQLPGRRWRLELTLSRPAWGWRLTWQGGDDAPEVGGETSAAGGAIDVGGTLSFEVRRPPAIDRAHPLRGRTIAVDPGHPPAGAHGPTGMYEGDANLAVARRLASLLQKEGATAVLVRDDTLPVGLYERARRAEDAGAELFVSVHQNALPDGVRPFGKAGSSTYFYHSNSRQLASDVQAGVLRNMRLRDLGIAWGDLAVARQSWMPSVLVEGAFIMMPRQEAALRTPAFQESYARGVLEGIREFLRSRARER